mgnify:FL=1|tara:strand:- start:1228 stop:1584 length:357 start_codon:yes stop_codon:yes gene_type:complete
MITKNIKEIQAAMLHPDVLQELISALDRIEGFDFRNQILEDAVKSIHLAINNEMEWNLELAYSDLGRIIYCTLQKETEENLSEYSKEYDYDEEDDEEDDDFRILSNEHGDLELKKGKK